MVDPSENPCHLTLPANQAALAPFPPTCPVLVSGDSSGGETYLGQIHSVYIDLGSATRENFYRVRPSVAGAAAAAAAETQLRSAPESALKYAPGCTVTANASALPPFVAGGGGDARDATIVSCVGGAASGSSSNHYYLLDVAPGPNDSWTNIQSTVPADAVRYRDSAIGERDDRTARVNSPRPHTIPADEDGSLKSSCKAPPVASIAFDNNRKRPAEAPVEESAQSDVDDGCSSTLTPMMPADGSVSIASNDAISEEVVRRIDIPDSVKANKIKGALVGPDCEINRRIESKFRVSISILGLGDITPDIGVPMEPFSKLGPISFKAGDKCIMIQGSERKVHDAAKVLIHMLLNKCYGGDDKNGLMREMRKVRQVRKKAESPRAMSKSLPSPTKRSRTERTEGFDAAESGPSGAAAPPPRGWSPPIEEDSQYEMISARDAQPGRPGKFSPSDGAELSNTRKNPQPVSHPFFIDKPKFDGKTWSMEVRSPIDRSALFGRIIGEGAAKKRELIDLFDRQVFFCLRGGGLRSKDGITDAADTSGPLRVSIKGSGLELVQRAAEHVADLLDRKCASQSPPSNYGRAIDDVTQQHNHLSFLPSFSREVSREDAEMYPRGPMRLVSDPVWIGSDKVSHWQVIVKSPISEDRLFGCLVGEGGKNKKDLARKFSKIFFSIRGEGLRLKNGTRSEGPLRVEVEGNDKEYVFFAARHVAEILDSGPLNDRLPTDSANRQHPADIDSHKSTESRHGGNKLLMKEPSFDGRIWSVKLISPLDRDYTFDVVIGHRGLKKKALERQFAGCRFFLRGKGSDSVSSRACGDDIDAPLHVLITARDRSAAEAATSHVTDMLLMNMAGETSETGRSRLDQSSDLRLPAPATPVDSQYGRQEWKAFVYASSNRLGDTSALYFGSVVGPGGSILRVIQRKFGVQVTVLGEGVTSGDVDHHPRDPMSARIVGPSRQSVDDAALHIARIWGGVVGPGDSTTDTSNMDAVPNYYRSNKHPRSSDRATSRDIGQQILKPHRDGKEWAVSVRSRICEESLFGTIIGKGSAKKAEILDKYPGHFICISGNGIRGIDGQRSDGPLRVVIRGPREDKVAAAAAHVADLIEFRYQIDRTAS